MNIELSEEKIIEIVNGFLDAKEKPSAQEIKKTFREAFLIENPTTGLVFDSKYFLKGKEVDKETYMKFKYPNERNI